MPTQSHAAWELAAGADVLLIVVDADLRRFRIVCLASIGLEFDACLKCCLLVPPARARPLELRSLLLSFCSLLASDCK